MGQTLRTLLVYDAYGNCSILEPNFAPDPDGQSDYENPYLFTGRRLDILNSGSLKIQYNRNRYYDYYTGRWLSHDPLGITPNGEKLTEFGPSVQYIDGLNLYEYATSNPVSNSDALGLSTVRDAIGDFWFFYKFWLHRYYGNGARWTSGAEKVKRQSKVKGPTADELIKFAEKRFGELRRGGKCHSSGWVILEVSNVYASDTIGMEASLFGPWGFYVRGRYHARRCLTAKGKCEYTIIFRNKYVWADMGDLRLDQWADRLVDRAERIHVVMHRLAVDFPVDIRWIALSLCTRVKGEGSKCVGWPFD